jgi:nitric oxide synthase-interacting protein
MTRKSKQAGGHMPLTYYERNTKFASSAYGTSTARLSSDSQLKFGDCSLGLSPAVDPVATPSGHVYSREAIVEYLLTKTGEVKKARDNYETYLKTEHAKEVTRDAKQKKEDIEDFENAQKVSAVAKKRTRDDGDVKPKSALARTSYWLAEYQPEHVVETPEPPPDRPPSPYSGQPLKLKSLRSLKFKRQQDKVVCALSDKTISTQPVVALPSGNVILKECYTDLVKPTMMDPFTSKKIKEKHVLELTKGKSGFASSGSVEAKKYRPTIT